MNFTGEPAKTKEQAEKNAAIAAWSSLKRMPDLVSLSQTSKITAANREEQDHINMAKVLSGFGPKDETISIRRRDQDQAAGRRMLEGHCRDIAGSTNSMQYQQKRLLDLLMDSASSEGLTLNKIQSLTLNKIQSPPQPRTTSKILPQTSSNSLSPSKTVMSKSQAKLQVVSPPFDEHQGDDDDLFNGKSELKKLPTEKGESQQINLKIIIWGSTNLHALFSV